MKCICVDFLNGNPDPVPNPDCPIHGAGLETQVPKVVVPKAFNTFSGQHLCTCPEGVVYRGENYCSYCGAKLNWSEA